jgi:LacI family transcriptional regulator
MRSISPLVEVVRDGLRKDILQAVPGEDYVIPSEREIGSRFGVSRTIVRGALQELAREGLMRVHSRCRPVAVPPPTRPTIRGKARHIGVWLWPFTDHFIVTALMRGIHRSVMNTDFRLVVGTAGGPNWEDVLASESAFLDALVKDEEAAGAIMWLLGDTISLPALNAARARGIEFVFVDRLPPAGFDADFVGTDNTVSARSAVNHLLDEGHRNIACYRNLDTANTVDERVSGYCRALEDLQLSPQIVQHDASYASESQACRATLERLLRQKDRPTAIFAINDSLALLILACLQEMKISVPEDISIVGFDGVLQWIPGGGSLTSACQDFSRIGELAMERLLGRIRGEASPNTHRHVLLEAPLRIQSSTRRPGRTISHGQSAHFLSVVSS